MKCTNCGARLLDADVFCPECGAKVVREKRCPECGALLREGTKFCNKCGSLVAGQRQAPQETLDIPIDAIERNILTETAAEIRADRRTVETTRKNTRAENAPERRTAEAPDRAKHTGAGDGHHTSKGAPQASSHRSPDAKEQSVHSPAKKNAASGRKTHYREDEWEDDWDEDDEDDWDDEDEGVDVITIMTAVIGCVILVIAVVLGYHMYQRYVPKDYEQAAEETQEETGQDRQQEVEQTLDEGGAETFTVTIVHNVNVRDNPSTTGTNILKVAREGETYTGVGRTDDGEWYEILLEDGSSGYVFHDYVTAE